MKNMHFVLFDFDGTLADSFDAIAKSVNHVRITNQLKPLTLEEVKKQVGHGLDRLMKETAPGVPLDLAKKTYQTHHESFMTEFTWLYPGTREFLLFLSNRGVGMAVCSNKPVAFTNKLLAYFKIAHYFPVILGPEDVAERKPNPEMLLEAMKRLGAKKENTMYLGDMQIDQDAGDRAGIPVYLLNHEKNHGFEALQNAGYVFGND